VFARLVETDSARAEESLSVLLRAVTHLTATYPGFVGDEAADRFAAPEEEILDVMSNAQRPGSLQFTLNAMLLAAQSIRDRLSDDSWRVINSLPQLLEQPLPIGPAIARLDRLILGLATFTGLSTEQMSRGSGWRFLDIGRRLERALFGCGLLRATCVTVDESVSAVWEALLGITDNWATYRRRYHSYLQEAPILDLLVFDESTPRSIAYQLARIQEHLAALPRKAVLPHRSAEEKNILEALTALRLADLDHLIAVSPEKEEREALEHLLTRLGVLLQSLSDSLTSSYFRQTDLPQQLVDIQ
jgi:uncharacterized alpha-E superfamily protein